MCIFESGGEMQKSFLNYDNVEGAQNLLTYTRKPSCHSLPE